jgi:hypothetical protein
MPGIARVAPLRGRCGSWCAELWRLVNLAVNHCSGARNDGTLGYTTRGSLGEHAAVAEEKLKFTWRAPPDWMWRALAGYMRSMPVQDFQRVRAGELLVQEALVSADAAVAKR